MSRSDIYKELHQQLAEEFGIPELAVSAIRRAYWKELSFVEMKKLFEERNNGRQNEIAVLLKRIADYSEVISVLNKLSQDTLDEIVNRKSGIIK